MELDWTKTGGVRYMAWFWDPTKIDIDADLLFNQIQYQIKESTKQNGAAMLDVASNGFGYYTAWMDIKNPLPPTDTALPFVVKTDHVSHYAPNGTYMPAADYTNLTSKNIVTVTPDTILIDTYFCKENQAVNKKWTVVIAIESYTAQCDTSNREAFVLKYGSKDVTRHGISEEEKHALIKWALSQIDIHSSRIGHTSVEVFWNVTDFVYGDVLPLSGFADMHTYIPTATLTATPTLTSTPRPPSTRTPVPTATR